MYRLCRCGGVHVLEYSCNGQQGITGKKVRKMHRLSMILMMFRKVVGLAMNSENLLRSTPHNSGVVLAVV